MVFVLSRWRRSLTFPSGTRRTSSTSAKRRFCATFDRRPLTRPLQSAIMILLVERPPEAPHLSRAEHLLYAHRQRVTINKSDSNPTSIFFSPFKKCCKREHLASAGCFLYAKKATAGTLAGDRWQRCGWPNHFYFTTRFWKSQKNIEKVLKKYKKSIDFFRRVWYYIITGRGKGTPTEAERRTTQWKRFTDFTTTQKQRPAF